MHSITRVVFPRINAYYYSSLNIQLGTNLKPDLLYKKPMTIHIQLHVDVEYCQWQLMRVLILKKTCFYIFDKLFFQSSFHIYLFSYDKID